MKRHLFFILLAALLCAGCQDRDDQVAWAGVWHIAEAMKRGYPVEQGAVMLQGMADKHAEINDYEIDKRGVPMIQKEDR